MLSSWYPDPSSVDQEYIDIVMGRSPGTLKVAQDLLAERKWELILKQADIQKAQELLRIRRQLYVGDQVTMEIWRDGERMEVTLTLTAPTE